MGFFEAFFGNKVILAALIAWFVAQVLKVAFELILNKKFNFRRIVGSGGMPSSHSSFIMSALTMIARMDGVASSTFALSFVVAAVIMYDATGVRRAAGQQAEVLNWMMDNWHKQDQVAFDKKLKQLLGHTPIEVFAGAILGVLIALSVKI